MSQITDLQSRNDVNKQLIVQFIDERHFCSAEEIVNGLTGKLSRATIFKNLKELQKEGFITNERKGNQRDNRFSVTESNPFIIAKRELDLFESTFFNVLETVMRKYPKLFIFPENLQSDPRFPDVPPEDVEWFFSSRFSVLQDLVTIFHAMMDRVMYMAKGYWGPKISDKETRLKLYGVVFLRINELENKLVERFDVRVQPHVVQKLQFWEHEKLHSIYQDIDENREESIIKYEETFGIEGCKSLLKMIELPLGVNVL